jgi:hypothetical protein
MFLIKIQKNKQTIVKTITLLSFISLAIFNLQLALPIIFIITLAYALRGKVQYVDRLVEVEVEPPTSVQVQTFENVVTSDPKLQSMIKTHTGVTRSLIKMMEEGDVQVNF